MRVSERVSKSACARARACVRVDACDAAILMLVYEDRQIRLRRRRAGGAAGRAGRVVVAVAGVCGCV